MGKYCGCTSQISDNFFFANKNFSDNYFGPKNSLMHKYHREYLSFYKEQYCLAHFRY